MQDVHGDVQLYSVYVPTNHIYVGDVFMLGKQDIIKVNLSVREGLGKHQKLLCASMLYPASAIELDCHCLLPRGCFPDLACSALPVCIAWRIADGSTLYPDCMASKSLTHLDILLTTLHLPATLLCCIMARYRCLTQAQCTACWAPQTSPLLETLVVIAYQY